MTLEDLDNLRALTRNPGWLLIVNDLEDVHANAVKLWETCGSDDESRRLQAKARAITWLLARPQSLIEQGTEATSEQDPA